MHTYGMAYSSREVTRRQREKAIALGDSAVMGALVSGGRLLVKWAGPAGWCTVGLEKKRAGQVGGERRWRMKN